jgi:hypothetical protein
MLRKQAIAVRMAAILVLSAMFGVSGLPASADSFDTAPSLTVWNPSAGDRLLQGSLVMQGIAFDPAASSGTGIDRVSVFLGDRDAGGVHLGNAVMDSTDTPTNTVRGGWTLATTVLRGTGVARTLYVYAHSGLSGREAVTLIPILIGNVVHPRGGGGISSETPRTAAAAQSGPCVRVSAKLQCGALPRLSGVPSPPPRNPVPLEH